MKLASRGGHVVLVAGRADRLRSLATQLGDVACARPADATRSEELDACIEFPHRTWANHEAIAAANAGIIGLMQAAAATYARNGVRINGVAPGLVRAPLTAHLTQEGPSFEASRRMHALGRIGEPADVARAIAWLLAPEQSWITGQVLGVDGGLAALRTTAGGR